MHRFDTIHAPRKSQSPQHGELHVAYDYDAKGNLLRKTEAVGLPEARVTETTRDAFGHVTTETKKGATVTLPNGTSLAIPDAVTSSQYDLQGNTVRITDAENAVTRLKHDLMGNLVELTDARNHTWKATYDPKGRLLTRTNPLDQATTHTYDKTGLPRTSKDAENKTTTFTPDAAGRIAITTDPLNHTRRQDYDALNRPVAETDEAGNRCH